jgi:osmotically-inducible protein OsmY
MSDSALKQDILDELEFEPSVDATRIGVVVRDGIVTLSGHVASYAQKVAVEQAVMRVKGVHGIAEEVEVRPSFVGGIDDDEIAARALAALRWSTIVPEGRLLVQVEHGKVSLIGTLDWAYQKRGALDIVRGLRGVTGLVDRIELAERVVTQDVRSAIERALRRNAMLDGQAVSVAVDGNKVTLDGRVRSWRDRHAAEDAAWSVSGVTEVRDRLRVG